MADRNGNPLMRIKSITVKDPAQSVIMNYGYTHDRTDNILRKETEHGAYEYTYDDLYRLTNVNNPTLPDEAYTYDPAGNRLTTADVLGNWVYNANNELSSYGDTFYQYDENGNTTQRISGSQTVNSVYDVENRLVRVEDGAGAVIAEYYYDPFGRRLWKEVGGIRTYFLYSDEGLVGEYNAGGNEIRSYGYRPDSTWTTDPLFLKQGSQYYFYHNDHLGTPQQMTALNGIATWSAKYKAFGDADIDPDSLVTNNLRFPGQYFDQETGLHYNCFRDYDSKTGRYTETDPIGFIGSDVDLYVYALNRPTVSADARGLSSDASNPETADPPDQKPSRIRMPKIPQWLKDRCTPWKKFGRCTKCRICFDVEPDISVDPPSVKIKEATMRIECVGDFL